MPVAKPSELNGTGGAGDVPNSVDECDTPSINRYQKWLASGEGPTLPQTGDLLVSSGDGFAAEATFTTDNQWHVLAIWLGNEFGASVDLSASQGFTLTYSATADFYIQLRPAAEWSGGSKWHLPIPSTEGALVTTEFSFEAAEWTERLGPPPHSFEDALGDASGFVVVGNKENALKFTSLSVDGYEPPCL